MNVTPEQIAQAEANPVLSRTHEWTDAERAEYDSLNWRGRRLYDDLRTQFDTSHGDAFAAALDTHGAKR